jgi:AcrR family transcriptional regulator
VPAAAAARTLDERLVRVALDLAAREGVESLTLRRIARRAGVSHGAPLRHFASLADLLAEVAARGFRLLAEAIERSAEGLPAGAGPRARLAAAGRAYVACAVGNPGLFALMFRPGSIDVSNPRFRRDSDAAFGQLLRLVRAAQDAGWQPGCETRLLAGAVWSAVHGLATLWAQGALARPLARASLEDALAATLDLALGPPPPVRPRRPARPRRRR